MRTESAIFILQASFLSILSPLSVTNTIPLVVEECWLMFMESCESIIRGRGRVRETINLAVSVEAFPTAPSDSIETG